MKNISLYEFGNDADFKYLVDFLIWCDNMGIKDTAQVSDALFYDYLCEKDGVNFWGLNSYRGIDDASGITLFDINSLVDYLFKQYDISWDSKSRSYNDSLMYNFISILYYKIDYMFFREWDRLKNTVKNTVQPELLDRADFMDISLKDPVRDWENLRISFCEHNGLLINKDFIDSNSYLLDKDEILDWCEYVVNKAFQELDVKYNKEIIEKFEQVEEQEQEIAR